MDPARCPACRGPGRPASLTLTIDESQRVRLQRCRTCGTEYWLATTSDAPTASEYWEGYKFDLYRDPAVQAAYEQRYGRLMTLLNRLGRAPATILDVGGGIGNFAAWASAQGMRAFMTDVDASAVDAARERGVEAFRPEALDGVVPAAGLDAVTLWDVVEHTADPESLVREALARVRPGGVLFFETPDVRFPLRRLLLAARRVSGGRLDRTSGMYYWEHKVYFTERGLRALLDRVGAPVIAVERWTSPRAKMVKLFSDGGPQDGSILYGTIARVYPLAEAVLERSGLGNKLIVVASPAGPDSTS